VALVCVGHDNGFSDVEDISEEACDIYIFTKIEVLIFRMIVKYVNCVKHSFCLIKYIKMYSNSSEFSEILKKIL